MFKIIRVAVGEFELRRMPWVLLTCAVLLALIGALFITSARSPELAGKHLRFCALGVAAFFCAALFNFRHLAAAAIPLYVAGLCALAPLLLIGRQVNLARRWYDLGIVKVQPSEPMKYILVIVLASYFCYRKKQDTLRALLPPLLLTLLPMGLVVVQPDLGTAMLFLPVFFAIAFLAGAPLRHLAVIALAGVVLLVAAWFTPGAIKQYQQDRLLTFIMPGHNPHSAAAYNAQQATIAISAGGLNGQGWGQGRLNRLGRLPERHTDFIFAVIAEEWGLWRTAVVLMLYLVLIAALAGISRKSRDPFGRLLAGGVLAIFAVQAVLHMAISLRLAPITGLTLPLVSYGGSSLTSTFAGLGLAASVALRRNFLLGPDDAAR